MKILIADDDNDIRKMLSLSLKAAGYDVFAAKDGNEAIDLFKKEAPDVVLLDVMMPNMDGFQTCDKIRELPGGAEVPVAFLTAHGTYGEAVTHGPNDFLTKPISRTELLSRVANLSRVKRLADTLRVNENQERLLKELQTKLGTPVADILAHARSLGANLKDPRQDEILKSAGQLQQLVDHLIAMSQRSK